MTFGELKRYGATYYLDRAYSKAENRIVWYVLERYWPGGHKPDYYYKRISDVTAARLYFVKKMSIWLYTPDRDEKPVFRIPAKGRKFKCRINLRATP